MVEIRFNFKWWYVRFILLGVFTKLITDLSCRSIFRIGMIIFLTIYPVLMKSEGLAHPYLTIVLGTIMIFLTGSVFQLKSYYRNLINR